MKVWSFKREIQTQASSYCRLVVVTAVVYRQQPYLLLLLAFCSFYLPKHIGKQVTL